MGKLKLLNVAAKRVAASARSLRCVVVPFRSKPTDPIDSKNVVSEQVSVATSESGPSLADVETPTTPSFDLLVQDQVGDPPSLGEPAPSACPPPSLDHHALRRTSVHIKSTVAEEVTESPMESGAEVLLTLTTAKRGAGFRRAATSALSKVSSGRDRCRDILLKSLASATLTQGATNPTDPQEKMDVDEAQRILEDIRAQGAATGGAFKSIEKTDPSSGGAAANLCEFPVSIEINVAPQPGLRPEDNQNPNDTVTLADSLTSDGEDSVNSDPFSKLSDTPKDLPVIDVGSLGSSGKRSVDEVEPTSTPGDEDLVPASQAATKNVASPNDQADQGNTRQVSFLGDFRRRHQRRNQDLPTVDEDRDLVGSEINCVRSLDEAESFQRNSSVLSTASSILVDDRSNRVLHRRKMRTLGTSCADNCDCLGSGTCEDRSVEFSNGSSIMSDDSEYEYSEASVPTCYICLQASEARGSIWQDLN